MDFSSKWSDVPKGPCLKNLTDGEFGKLKDSQQAAVQDLTKAHIESFDQAVTDGLSYVVEVSYFERCVKFVAYYCANDLRRRGS